MDMTEKEKTVNNIENINFKLKNLGISAFAIHFGAEYKPESQNLTDYSSGSVLIYRCEFQVPTIHANLIIEFKFTPLLDGSRDVVEILTIKSLQPRDFSFIQNSNGLYELYEEVNVKKDIEKFNSTWDKIMSDPNAKKIITEKERRNVNDALQSLRIYKDEFSNLNSTYSVRIDSAVHTNSELNLSAISMYLSNPSVMKKIIYLFLQHRSENAKINKKILSPNEKSLKDFSWEEYYKSNLNVRKNLAINYLSKLNVRDLNEIVFNVNYNRTRGGFDRTHNRTTLSLAYFTILSEHEELSKDDVGKINTTFSEWKIKEMDFRNTLSELRHNDNDNSLYFSLIENFYQNIFNANKDRYFKEDLKTKVPEQEQKSSIDYNFRFRRNSLKVLFSNLKSRGFIDTFNNKYVITDKGIDQFKNAVLLN